MTVSAPSDRKSARGRRLTINDSLTAVFTWERAQVVFFWVGVRVVITGYNSRVKIINRLVVIIRGVGCIAATWICTKSFWFLRPMDELLSFRSFVCRVSAGI